MKPIKDRIEMFITYYKCRDCDFHWEILEKSGVFDKCPSCKKEVVAFFSGTTEELYDLYERFIGVEDEI
jgi:predicted Zn-ribbon and HTH transcriptional regulator